MDDDDSSFRSVCFLRRLLPLISSRMKLTLAVMLVLSVTVLAIPTEAGWVRRTLGKVGDATKSYVKTNGIKGVVDIVTKYGPGLVRLGKRSANGCGSPVDQMARSLMAELELKCPTLFGMGRQLGLTTGDISSIFQQTDGNKDKTLDNQELNVFENTIDAMQHCFDILKKTGK
ncbi:hypothetical protein ACOMHN_037301 [Nucella lapillus]